MKFSLELVEITFWLLAISWIVFWLTIIWAAITGFFAVRATRAIDPSEEDRARRTNWTARLTISLPALLFLLLTFAGWAGILKLSLPLIPHVAQPPGAVCPPAAQSNPECRDSSQSLCYVAMFPRGQQPQPIHCWSDDLLSRAGLSFIPVLLVLTCIAALISVWALFPSVLGEILPPRGPAAEEDPVKREKKLKGLETESEALGNWLDYGYQFMRWAGRLIYLGIVVFPMAMVITGLFNRNEAYEFSATLGTIVAGTAVGILGLGGRLSKLALGFRPVVRVALDVDNWLREHPLDSNPTARICGRYVSLLRYIAQWEGEDQRGYDALIIFAHSQGTVITADLLRFLHAEAAAAAAGESETSYRKYDSTLARFDEMPVYLFTVGCPLRQLYGLRFPYLYGYAPTEPHADILPKPEDLGVAKWVNAYRTGDYVGRYLWKPHLWHPVGPISFSTWDPPQSMPTNIWTQDGRFEFSIGPGAHTHYWDSTAQPIAETLDVLIARAQAGAPSPPSLPVERHATA